MSDRNATTAKLITDVREAMGLSKTQFAKHLGISTNYLSRIERGLSDNLSTEYALNIAKKLSQADVVKTRTVNLDNYESVQLAQLIKSELQTDEPIKLYSSDVPFLKELNKLAPYAMDEIRLVVEHAKRNKAIEDIKNTLQLHSQDESDYDYSASILKVLSNPKLYKEFNAFMNEARKGIDEKIAVTAFIRLLSQGEILSENEKKVNN